jgi:hypothetical protein
LVTIGDEALSYSAIFGWVHPASNPKLVEEGRPHTTFAIAMSDAFFERPENRVRAQGSQRALIDGDHSLAKALHNFENLETLAAPNPVIAIHDVVPMTWMPRRQRRRPRQRSISATWRLMKMLTEGRLADSEWWVEDKDYSSAEARRPFTSFMLQCMSPLLAQSGHPDALNQCPLLGVKRSSA